jgi:hypothetical protein
MASSTAPSDSWIPPLLQVLMRTESLTLRAELESAAELAERQNALTITLEGRLEALSAEKAFLQNQMSTLQVERVTWCLWRGIILD